MSTSERESTHKSEKEKERIMELMESLAFQITSPFNKKIGGFVR